MAPSQSDAETEAFVKSFVKAFPANATKPNQELFRSLYLEMRGDGSPTIEKIRAIEQVLASAGFNFPGTVKIWKPLLYFAQHFAWLYRPVHGHGKKYRLYIGKVTSASGHDQQVWAEISKGRSWTLRMYTSLHEIHTNGRSALWAWKRGDRMCMKWYHPLQRLFRIGAFPKKDFGDKTDTKDDPNYAHNSRAYTYYGKWDDHQNDHIKAIILLVHAFPGMGMKRHPTQDNTVVQIWPSYKKFPFLEDVITPDIPLSNDFLVDMPAVIDNPTAGSASGSGSSPGTTEIEAVSQTSTIESAPTPSSSKSGAFSQISTIGFAPIPSSRKIEAVSQASTIGTVSTPSSSKSGAFSKVSGTRSASAPVVAQTTTSSPGPGIRSTSSLILSNSSAMPSQTSGFGSASALATPSPGSALPEPPITFVIGSLEIPADGSYNVLFAAPTW